MTQKVMSRPPNRNRTRKNTYQHKRTVTPERARKAKASPQRTAKINQIKAERAKAEREKKSTASANNTKQGASGAKQGAWKQVAILHARHIAASWKKFWQVPFSNFFTVLVLGLVLALPTLFHVSLSNFETVMAGWRTSDKISVFMESGLSENSIFKIKKRIQSHVSVYSVKYISPEQGLKEFKDRSGLNRLIDAMTTNPLPPVLEVIPVNDIRPVDIKRLAEQIERFQGIDSVKQDEIWVQRLHAFIDLGKNVTWALIIVLGVTVLLSIANTIRLLVINRQEEIRIIRLVGGSRGYVMLPFLYSGMWYGLLSSILACCISVLLFFAMTDSVAEIASLYRSTFEPHFLSATEILLLIISAVFISILGALLATSRQLKKLDKQEKLA